MSVKDLLERGKSSLYDEFKQKKVELEKRRFYVTPVIDGVVVTDEVGERRWYFGPGGSAGLVLKRAMELAAVLGIAPPGYRLVPEEVAQKVLPVVRAMAEQKRIVAEELFGVEERAEAFEEYSALLALAEALNREVEEDE